MNPEKIPDSLVEQISSPPEMPVPPVKKETRGRHKKNCVCPGCSSRRIKIPVSDGAMPDSDLFGNIKPPLDSGEKQEGQFDLPPENETPKDEAKPEDHRPLSSVLWDSIISFLSLTIGKFWLPRKVGDNAAAGEIPFDEREMVITAFCEYFAAIGLKALSPAQELVMAISAYSTPRLFGTIEWLKIKFMKKARPSPITPDDPRVAKTEKTGETAKPEKTVSPDNTSANLDALK